MRFFDSFLWIFTIPFALARVFVLLFLIFTLFCIFKNWDKRHNKELMNSLILSTILLVIISILYLIVTRLFFGYYTKSGDIFLLFFAILVIAIVYLVGNSSVDKIYPRGYFDNISNSEFLQREISNSINYLISSLKKETAEVKDKAFSENNDRYNPNYSNNRNYSYNNSNNYSNDKYNGYGNPRNFGPAPFRGYLKDDWSYLIYIILSVVTCNLYHYYFIYKAAESVNIACDGDGEHTGGLLKFLGLGIITCGFYCLFWEYSIMNRMASNGPRYGRNIQDNGGTFLLWFLLGSWICGLGFIVSWYLLFKNLNIICNGYNMAHANN